MRRYLLPVLSLIALDYLSLSSANTFAYEGGNEYIQASLSRPLSPAHKKTLEHSPVKWTLSTAVNTQRECPLSSTPFAVGTASWYGPGFEGKPMANGSRFRMLAATIAHLSLPLGTRVCIKNPENERVVVATVTDRGPYVSGRIVDLSLGVARALAIGGLGKVEIFVI